ncbi:MAG: NADH-quinone oxidoreductase subunit C [Elusimicrobia bacterium]|nr:NADH-quinone oxidoreductase subunit C [Elusimicrobiota bacterium]
MIAPELRRCAAANNVEELKALKEQGYNVLVDMTAVDYLGHPKPPIGERFDVIYQVMKLDAETGKDGGRVELHCGVGEEPVLRSAASLWPVADWLEREVWDMFGVGFADRPRIKRLLMYEEFQGHPLRKDYPIAKRQPLIGPDSGELPESPSFNVVRPTIKYD